VSTRVVLQRVDDPSAAAKKSRRRQKKEEAVDDGRARYGLVGPALRTTGSRVYLGRLLPQGGVKEYLDQRKRGVRCFVLWTDMYRQHVWARVVTAGPDEGGPIRYDVYGPDGEHVGRVTRARAFAGGHVRTRWTVQQAGGETAVGYKGRCFWWGVWWLIFPLQCVLLVVAIVGGDGEVFRTPRRIGYRRGGARVLDYGSGFDSRHLAVQTDDWDPRLLAALTALHSSHDGILGDCWDKDGSEPAAPIVGATGFGAGGRP
jgi:hypothetical protein